MEKVTQMFMCGSVSGSVGLPSPTAQPGSRTDVFIAGQGLHIQLGIGGFQCDAFYKKQPVKQTKKVEKK